MSKLNIFGSVEDELLRIAIDKGWVKNSEDLGTLTSPGQDEKKYQEHFLGGLDLINKLVEVLKNNFSVETTPEKIASGLEDDRVESYIRSSGLGLQFNSLKKQFSAAISTQNFDQISALVPAIISLLTQRDLETKKPVPQEPGKGSPYQKNETILKFQGALLKLMGADPTSVGKKGPDGVFGPATANLWNHFVQKFPKLKLQTVNPKNPRDVPGFDILNSVIGLSNMNPELQKKYLFETQPVAAPAKKEFEPKVPEWAKADDGLLSTAEAPLTPRQQEVITKVMKAKGLDFETAVQEAQRLFPNVFAPEVKPQFALKVPEWATDKKDPYAGMAIKTPALPQGGEMLKNIQDQMEKRSPSQTKYDVPVSKPSHWETGVPDVIPTTSAFVVKELISLANELDALGEVKAADAVDQQIKIYKEAMDKLYDITGETGEKLIGMAHPGKSTVIAPAKEEGGLVENIIEQQKKDIDAALKNPTGKLASLLTKLVSTANMLDERGDWEGAKIVDKAIAELRDRVLPFVDRDFALKAAGSEDKKALAFTKLALGSPTEEIANLLDFLNEKVSSGGPAEQHRVDLMVAPLKNKLNYYINTLSKIDIESDDIKNLNYYLANLNLIMEDFKKIGLNKIIENHTDKIAFEWKARSVDRSILNTAKDIAKKIESIKQYSPEVAAQKIEQKQEQKPQQKPETKQTSFSRDKELKRLIYNLDSAISAIKNSYDSAKKAFGGSDNVDIWIKMLNDEKQKASSYDTKKIENRNNAIFNYLIPFLKRKGIKVASLNTLTKQADEFEDALKRLAPAAPAAKPKAKSQGVRVSPDPQVKALQEALIASGISVGKRGADGLWGPYTAMAYNKFIETHGGSEKFLQRIDDPTKQRHQNRPVTIIPKAIKMIQYMAGKEKQVGSSVIELAGGINIPLSAMVNPQSFVEHMQANGIVNFPPKAALQYLNELTQYISGNELDMEGKQPGMVKQWQSAIFNLTRQFQNYEKSAGGQTGTAPGQKPSGQGQKTYMYPWDAQKTPGEARNEKQVAPGRAKSTGAKFGSPQETLKSLYKIRPDMFEDADLFKVKAQQLNKNPEQYLRDIYRLLGKISNTLDSQQEQMTATKEGATAFDEAQTYMADISAALKRLADKLNTSLFEEKKERAPKPQQQVASREYQGQHEAETAPVYGQPQANPNLKQYTNPMTGETVVDDSRFYGGR